MAAGSYKSADYKIKGESESVHCGRLRAILTEKDQQAGGLPLHEKIKRKENEGNSNGDCCASDCSSRYYIFHYGCCLSVLT